ncbi:MAG TPA: ATP-binding protein [Clostridia bacterium]|nr:ATP-binding protein [Clostridia bacterium]
MRKKIALYNVIISIFALLLMFSLGLIVTDSNNRTQAKEKIVQITDIYAAAYADSGYFSESYDENIRITVIGSDGTVISDSQVSDVSTMENHSDRPEIISAFTNEPTVVTRSSDTLGKEMMYYAVKVDMGETYVFVRVSMPMTTISSYLVKTLPLLILILFSCVVFAAIISIFANDKLLAPISLVRDSLRSINEGSYHEIKPTYKDEDLNSLLCEINDVSAKVKDNLVKAREEKNKLNYILNNINDSIFAVDKNANLVLLNEKAKSVFGVTDNILGKNAVALTENEVFLNQLKNSITKNTNTVFETAYNEKIFSVTIKNLDANWLDDASGEIAVVILSDITGAKTQEKVRSEFFENASHELKTPLTSIKGFNEMLSLNNKEPELDSFIAQISKETDRMLSLVEDMLKLSKLENTTSINKTKVNISEIVNSVAESLAPLINSKKIKLQIDGNGQILADKKHIYELIKNLVENAVKYNVENGQVKVDIIKSTDKTILTVSDSGIGIEPKHLSRIFERFYRVDNSRSRATGGTGLGLSIVKHICNLYNANLSLTSKLSVGTTVTVEFKNE